MANGATPASTVSGAAAATTKKTRSKVPICPLARLPEGPPDGGAGSAGADGAEAAGEAGGGTAVEGCVIGGSSGANGRLDAVSDAFSRHGSAEKTSSGAARLGAALKLSGIPN